MKIIASTTNAKTISPVSLDFFIRSDLSGHDENIHPPVAGNEIQTIYVQRPKLANDKPSLDKSEMQVKNSRFEFDESSRAPGSLSKTTTHHTQTQTSGH
jgi:hypothetical protein